MEDVLKLSIRSIVARFPAVLPHLKGRARWIVHAQYGCIFATDEAEFKTQDAYYRQIWNLTLGLYRGEIGENEFVDGMADVIQEQLTRAFREALRQNDMDPDLVNEGGEGYADELETMILSEYDFVDGFAADIQAAAKDEAGFEQFQSRAQIWANRYAEAVNRANEIIAAQNGNNLEWELGQTEEHCETCAALNGLVAPASVWEELGVHPQEPPNEVLTCKGWHCDCRLTPTDKRRSPKVYATIMNIVSR